MKVWKLCKINVLMLREKQTRLIIINYSSNGLLKLNGRILFTYKTIGGPDLNW